MFSLEYAEYINLSLFYERDYPSPKNNIKVFGKGYGEKPFFRKVFPKRKTGTVDKSRFKAAGFTHYKQLYYFLK